MGNGHVNELHNVRENGVVVAREELEVRPWKRRERVLIRMRSSITGPPSNTSSTPIHEMPTHFALPVLMDFFFLKMPRTFYAEKLEK